MIDSYEFGTIIIDDREYTGDVLVFPERVLDSWWRKEGHRLIIEDLDEIFKHEPKPDVIVVGTGFYGLVKISSNVENTLSSRGIELIAKPTREATQTFNRLLQNDLLTPEQKRKVIVGAFHLTC